MKAKILKKLAETITKKPATEQFKKVRQLKKETNDLAKKNNIEVGTGKYGVLNDKLNKSIGNKNLSEAKKIVKDMKDFINNKKDTPKKQIKGVKAGIKTLSKAEKKIKTPAKEPLRVGTKEFNEVLQRKIKEAKAKGQKRISINNVLKKTPTGGYENQPKKYYKTIERAIDPKTGKKRARKKDLTGLTPKQKMERKALVSDARKKMKGQRRETEGMGEKGATVRLGDRVQSLNNKAKGKTPAQILKEGRVSPVTNRYVNPNFIERTDAAALPKMSKEARRMRRMAQLKVLPKGFFKNKTEELDVVRGDIPPRLTAQQIMEEMRENVLRGTKVVGREIEEKGISGPAQKTVVKSKTAEIAVPASQEIKKFPKRKTLSVGDKLKGTLATERNIKKQILKVNKGDFGGPNKSLVSDVPNRPIGKKEKLLVEKGVAYDKKTKTAQIYKFRKDEIQKYRKALNSAEKSLMSNTAKATLNDLKNRSVIKNAIKGSPYGNIKNRVSKLIEKQKELKPKLIGSLRMKLDNLANRKPAATGVKEKFGVIPRKKGGMLNYKAGTKRKTVGKSSKPKLGKFKGAMLSLMPMNVVEGLNMLDTAVNTGLPFKSGTGNKTIRGVGKAMRGYGKAMTGRKR